MNIIKEENSKNIIEEKRRVKFYRLSTQGGWNDLGTGYVFVTKQSPFYLSMINESNKEILFKFSLSTESKFHLQRNTIITWKESNEIKDDNLALSFQDIQGVKDIWQLITAIKGKDAEKIKDLNEEISIDNLPFIIKEIQPTSDASKLKTMLNKIKHNDCLFIKQLGRLLEEEERKLNEEKASNCSIKTNTTIPISDQSNNNEEKKMSADADLLEKLMSDSLYNVIFASLEYDFESQKLMKHRQYLNEIANFDNIISIREEKIIEKIQVNYRLAYLRDTVLARFLEVNGFTVVNKIIQMNNTEIVQALLSNKEYIDTIIHQLLSNDMNRQYKAILFLAELINCSKELLQRLTNFQEMLFQSGLLQTIEFILIKYSVLVAKMKNHSQPNHNEEILMNNIICRSIELLSDFIVYFPYLLKDYLSNTNNYKSDIDNDIKLIKDKEMDKENCLLDALTNLLQHSKDSGIKSLIGQIIKQFIKENQDLNINQDSIIFINCLNKLSSFLNYTPCESDIIERSSIILSKQIILDILSHCLNQLKDHMQYWFIHNNIITKVLNAINDQNKMLTLSVVKFIKVVIETNNYNYQKTLLLSECFDEIFHLFQLNKQKDNLLLSSIMSLFDSINTSNCNNKLIEFLFMNYSEIIYKIDNERFFGNLIKRYELRKDYNISGSRNESMAFHGLFSMEFDNNIKEEEYDEIGGIMNLSKQNQEVEMVSCTNLTSFPIINLNDTYLLQSHIADSQSFLNKKRSADS